MSDSITTITYRVYRDSGLGPYRIGPDFDSEMSAKLYATQQQSTVEEYYEIRSQIVTITTLDSFTVPAHVPTLEEIAQDIIASSDGSFYMEWGDNIEQLSDSDRSKVEDMVWEEIAACDCCGRHFQITHLENIDGQDVCYQCADDLEEEDEEDED